MQYVYIITIACYEGSCEITAADVIMHYLSFLSEERISSALDAYTYTSIFTYSETELSSLKF